jgi:hypothetical protein
LRSNLNGLHPNNFRKTDANSIHKSVFGWGRGKEDPFRSRMSGKIPPLILS